MLNFFAAAGAAMRGSHHLDGVGWLLPVQACQDLDFDATTDAIGQSAFALESPSGPEPPPDTAPAQHQAPEELEGTARRAHAVWLASTLPARASACRPASSSNPAPMNDSSLPAQGAAGHGERLDSAEGVLAAVVARRRRLQQAKTGPCAPVEERQSGEDEHGGQVTAKQSWRGRRKRNKKGLAAQEQGSSAPELPCSNRSLNTRDAACSYKGEARELDASGAEVAASEQGAGVARDAAWYSTRRRKSDRKLAQVRFVRVDAKSRMAMHGARASVYTVASWPLSSLSAPNSSRGIARG